MSNDEHVQWFEGEEPGLVSAARAAQDTFRYFWRELSYDFNRVIPALEMACVKAQFSDDGLDSGGPIEHLWVENIDFDGDRITGALLNDPEWIECVNEGDQVSFSLNRLSDWMSVTDNAIQGAYSVQFIRSQLSNSERKEHDAAWGRDFGDPGTILVPKPNGRFETVVAGQIKKQISIDAKTVNATFNNERTLLHLESLYGRIPSVEILLKHGASVNARCDRGWTPIDYANAVGWRELASVLAIVG